jgi:hypothetical protein
MQSVALLLGLFLVLAASPLCAQVPVTIAVSSGGGTISTYTNAMQAGGGAGNMPTGGFAVDILTVSGTAVNVAPHATFCTELGEQIGFANYSAFEIVPLQFASAGTAGDAGTPSSSIPIGGIGLQAAAQLRYLFDQYYVSETLSSWTTTQSQAFQLAVWEIGHDPNNFTVTSGPSGGVFYVPTQSDAGRNAAIALAQTMLTAVQTANVQTGYVSTTVDVWSLADDNGINATTGYQDILFATFKNSPDGQTITPLLPTPVPEPSTGALVVAALGIIGLRRRQ